MAVMQLSLAVNRSFKKNDAWQDEASFFDVEVWGKLAERLSGITKGQRVLISGSLKQERWEKDGKIQSKVKIVADTVELIQRHEKKEAQGNATPANQKANEGEFTDDVPF